MPNFNVDPVPSLSIEDINPAPDAEAAQRIGEDHRAAEAAKVMSQAAAERPERMTQAQQR
jgi:hypothetical protein